jgi:hypothetical protein
MKRITGRSWAFVIYPDSMPTNWEEIISDTGLPIALSPLHDKDLNPDGTHKKPHFHVLCYYDNPTTLNNVKTNVCDKLNGTIPIKLESLKGMYRYHIHLDNPEKYQYDDRDRRFYNGFDIDEVGKLTRTETLKMIKECYQFCEKNKISEYSDLVNILILNDMIQMLDVVSFNTLPIKTFLESKRYKKREYDKKIKELLY